MQLNDHQINIWDTKSYAEFLIYLFRENMLPFFIEQSISTKVKKLGWHKIWIFTKPLQNSSLKKQKGMDYFSQ